MIGKIIDLIFWILSLYVSFFKWIFSFFTNTSTTPATSQPEQHHANDKDQQARSKESTHEIPRELRDNNFIVWAREAEANENFLLARINYMKCVEDMRRSKITGHVFRVAEEEYDNFVMRDPFYRAGLKFFKPIIEKTPVMMQSGLSKQLPSMNWPTLCNASRPPAKEDLYYILYFAAKFGEIRRVKKGRSYQLYLV